MLVKQRYSFMSEQVLYEWSLQNANRYNMSKVYAYDFWVSIKNKECSELMLSDIVRLDKIIDAYMRELKRPTYRR